MIHFAKSSVKLPLSYFVFAAFLYELAIIAGHRLMLVQEPLPPTFWPATGVYFATILFCPPKDWGKVVVAALSSWLAAAFFFGVPISPLMLPFFLSKTMLLFFTTYLFHRLFVKFEIGSFRYAIFLVLGSGIVIPALAGLVATAFIPADNFGGIYKIWLPQFVGNSLGILIVTPFTLAIYNLAVFKTWHVRWKDLVINTAILFTTAAAAAEIFLFRQSPAEVRYPFMIFPFVFAASVRGSGALTATTNFIIAMAAACELATVGAFAGYSGKDIDNVYVVHFFVIVVTFVSFFLTTAVYSRAMALRDLAQNKKEVDRINADLDRANAAKSQFLANMSHEFRSPLGSIVGFSDLLTSTRIQPEEKLRYIEIIKRNSLHLWQLIDQILDLSKIESGHFEIQARPVVLKKLIDDVVSQLAIKAKEKGLNVCAVIDPRVPLVINTDPMRLRQILINGLSNAVKFTAEGSVRLSVKVEDRGTDRWRLICDFEDTGIGLSSDEQAKIFEAFSQADASISRRFGGTGLGLALSRSLARLLGGDFIILKSKKGVGTTFRLEIDAGVKCNDAMLREVINDAVSVKCDNDHLLSNVSVLVADDAPDNRMLVGHMLQLSGAAVDEAEDGAVALKLANTHQYDVILMDIEMPNLDGTAATRSLRAAGYSGPIIALTGRCMKDEVDDILRAGFSGHLKKPIRRDVLIPYILKILSGTYPKDPREKAVRATPRQDSSLTGLH